MKIKPTRKFYFGCFIIVVFGIFVGFLTPHWVLSILLPMMGLVGFIDLELINILVKDLDERRTAE